MSNGSRSCPPVTLPFGVFPATETICPLVPGDFPGPDPPPCLEEFIQANSPTDATALDGFDQYFTDTVTVLDALDAALGSLEGDLASSFTEADTIDAGPVRDTQAGLTAAVNVVSTGVDDLGTLLGTASGPGAPAGAGGTYKAKIDVNFPPNGNSPLTLCVSVQVT